MNLPKQSFSRLIFRWWRNLVCVILVVNMKHAVTDLDRPNTLDIAMAIYILECSEVELLFLQDAIVTKLIPRLLVVELVFKHVNLVVQLLQLVEERALVCGYDD